MKRSRFRFSVVLLLASFPVSIFAQQVPTVPTLQPLKGTPLPTQPKDPKKFMFIFAGDNRPENEDCPPTGTVKKIFKAVRQKSPAFVLWSGDVIYGKNPDKPKKVKKQYKDFLRIAADGQAPLYNAPGNHEMNDGNNCPNPKMLKLYLDETAQAAPYGSFDYGDSHFIALDSDEPAPDNDPCNCGTQPDDEKPPGYISQTQLKWLAKDLSDNRNKDHIFIFLHRPLKGYKGKKQLCAANVSAMEELFEDYPTISYVVAGHDHMYYNEQGKGTPDEFKSPPPRKDPSKPPYYLISGGAGAPLKEGTEGSFFHYVIFNVDKDTVTAERVRLDESKDVN